MCASVCFVAGKDIGMIRAMPRNLDYKQVFRYLGAKEQPIPESMQALLNRAQKELWRTATPRAATRRMPMEQMQPLLQGQDILLHLQGCNECLLFGVTLGSAVDVALRRALAMDMVYAVVLDAAASVLVEQVAEELEQELRTHIEQQNQFMTGRFSPGYGDWPIAIQPQFVQWLDGLRQAGLCTTSSCLLTPGKSITALCGIADHPVTGKLAGCKNCVLRDTCTKRKEGEFCGKKTI